MLSSVYHKSRNRPALEIFRSLIKRIPLLLTRNHRVRTLTSLTIQHTPPPHVLWLWRALTTSSMPRSFATDHAVSPRPLHWAGSAPLLSSRATRAA